MRNIFLLALLVSFSAVAEDIDCESDNLSSVESLQRGIQNSTQEITKEPMSHYRDGFLFAYLDASIGDEVYVDLPNKQRNGPYIVQEIERRFKDGKSLGYYFNIRHGDGSTKWYERNHIAQLTNKTFSHKVGQSGHLRDETTGQLKPVTIHRIAKSVHPNCPTVVDCANLKTLLQFEENGKWYRDSGWFEASKDK